VAGNWSGSWTFVTAGVTVTDNAHASVSVDGTGVHGTWTAESGPGGTFTFASLPSGAAASGTLTIAISTLSGTCSAQASVSGTATTGALDLVVAALPSNANCVWATDQRFAFKK
jgi:hypothetical protein